MKKIRLLFTSALLCGLVTTGWGQIISQYVETNSGTTPKGIEIWNNTGSTLDFSVNNLVIEKGTNGASPSPDFTLSTGTLAAGDVIVIGTGGGDLETVTNNNSATFHSKSFTFNGDDALVVKYGSTTTDVFGDPGNDPGSSWSGSGVDTRNQNIELNTGISTGTTTGFTDPSTRFNTVSTNPSGGTSDLAGFGIAPSTATPDITIADANQPSAGNINQGAQDAVIAGVSAAVTTANATLNTFDVTINGTFDSDDVDNFQLFYSTTNSFGSAAQIGSNIAGNGNGTSQALSFTSLSQSINDGVTGYFWVVADVSATATAGNTLNADAPVLTFASGNITNNATNAASGMQTIQSVTPAVTLADNGTQITAANVVEVARPDHPAARACLNSGGDEDQEAADPEIGPGWVVNGSACYEQHDRDDVW